MRAAAIMVGTLHINSEEWVHFYPTRHKKKKHRQELTKLRRNRWWHRTSLRLRHSQKGRLRFRFCVRALYCLIFDQQPSSSSEVYFPCFRIAFWVMLNQCWIESMEWCYVAREEEGENVCLILPSELCLFVSRRVIRKQEISKKLCWNIKKVVFFVNNLQKNWPSLIWWDFFKNQLATIT